MSSAELRSSPIINTPVDLSICDGSCWISSGNENVLNTMNRHPVDLVSLVYNPQSYLLALKISLLWIHGRRPDTVWG